MGALMVCVVFHVCVVSEVAPALSISFIRGDPPSPGVVKKYVCDPEFIPTPDRSWLCKATTPNIRTSVSSESHLRESMDRPRWPCDLATQVTDLKYLDFFLWGHMKQLVYETIVETEEDLVATITVASGTIADMPGILERTRQSMI